MNDGTVPKRRRMEDDCEMINDENDHMEYPEAKRQRMIGKMNNETDEHMKLPTPKRQRMEDDIEMNNETNESVEHPEPKRQKMKYDSENDLDSFCNDCLSSEEDNFEINVDKKTEIKKPWQLREELASWATDYSDSPTSVSALLKILRPFGFDNLPCDSRSLMKTPRETNSLIRNVSPGQYVHIGLAKGIEFQLKRNGVDISQIRELVIDTDCDGVKICKSTTNVFWPIWCRIRIPFIGVPFLVGNYFGKGGPADSNLYLHDYVTEIDSLIKNGLKIENNIIAVRFGRFIGDTPGRCDMFGLKGPTGYYGCHRCTTQGSRHQNRICFLELDAPLRTDQDFKDRKQPQHHNKTSTMESTLGVKCISQAPLDGMHLLYACLTNRICFWLVTDEVNFKFKLSSAQMNAVNNKLEIAGLSLPKEFSRPVKDIRHHKLFKCTQHRLFLLYLSIVVLKDVLPKFQYDHFLLLYVGIRILSDEKQFKLNNSIAKGMLKEYVQILGSNFGKFRVIYCVHMLIHLADETIIQDQPLDRFAMWEFETANASLKRFSKRQGVYLQQTYNRTIERYTKSSKTVIQPPSYPVLKCEIGKKRDKDDQLEKFFLRIEFENFMLDTTYGNRWFLTNSGDIVKFENAIEVKTVDSVQIKIRGRSVKNKNNFFQKPVVSSFLNIFQCSDKKMSEVFEIDAQEIASKVFMIQNGQECVFIPML